MWLVKLNILNSDVSYLTRGFIASTRDFNLITRAFNLPTLAFSPPTRAFNLANLTVLTREFELTTRGFELVTCKSYSCFTFPQKGIFSVSGYQNWKNLMYCRKNILGNILDRIIMSLIIYLRWNFRNQI